MNFFLLISLVFGFVNGAKILGYFPVPITSHQRVYQSIWQELSLRGHQVTIITPNPLNNPQLQNLTEIDVGYVYERIDQKIIRAFSVDTSVWQKLFLVDKLAETWVFPQFEDKHVKKLMDSDERYDLILVSPTFNLAFAVPAKFKSPTIVISSLGVFPQTHDSIGNPTHPLLHQDMLNTFDGTPTFWTKVNNVIYHIGYRALYYGYFLPKADRAVKKYFGDHLPYLGDVEKNVSLVLVNENYVMNTARANVANIIDIGQVHIKKKKPLPKDLQEYLDKSPGGVIYLSFGSNVRSANLSETFRDTLTGALSELPYNVLLKWETDLMPGKPKNVLIRKWLPQQDILGHPNVKVFVTQGGYQSIEEAFHNAVPMVGIPFISDQPTNVQKLVQLGIAIKLDHNTVTKEELKEAILEVAKNKQYKESVLKARSLTEDQPLKGLEKAIWWIEYVIRHNGATHLRSPATKMPFYKYLMLDVIFFLLFVIIGIFVTIYHICKVTVRIFSYPKSAKEKMN